MASNDKPIYEMLLNLDYNGNKYPKGSRCPEEQIQGFLKAGYIKLYAPVPLPPAPSAPVSGEGQVASEKLAELKASQAKAEQEAKDKLSKDKA